MRAKTVGAVLGAFCCLAVIGTVPAGASAASISGHVSAANGGAAIAGVQVCQRSNPPAGEEGCVETDAGGNYVLGNLGPGTYFVRFSGDSHNLNYVSQNWQGTEEFPGTAIVLGQFEARSGIDAAMGEGATIEGTVTAADTGLPLAGFLACGEANIGGHVGFRCARTGVGGVYQLHGLPEAANYKVSFEGGREFNYQTQYYEDSSDYFTWDPVEVHGAGTTTNGIDAVLDPGSEVIGTLYEAGSHRSLPGVRVSVLSLDLSREDPMEPVATALTDGAGRYDVRGLAAGDYVVGFSYEERPGEADGFSTQWWSGAAEYATATHLHLTPPTAVAGIDGEVVNLNPPALVTSVPPSRLLVSPHPRSKPRHCGRGKHRKRVHGRSRCLRNHKAKAHRQAGHR